MTSMNDMETSKPHPSRISHSTRHPSSPSDSSTPNLYSIKPLVVLAVLLLSLASMTTLIQRLLNRTLSNTTMPLADTPLSASSSGSNNLPKATVAAGCFWGVEHAYRAHFSADQIKDYKVGYTAGGTDRPSYRAVCSGSTGHAEALQMAYDPERVSYRALIEFFYKMHDPTTLNAQGGDRGTQYRSGIYWHDEAQRQVAEEVTKQVQEQWWTRGKVTTELAQAGKWWDAEDYHQMYLHKNPGGYECPSHHVRPFPELK